MNQNPKQLARDKIAAELIQCGRVIQNKNHFNLNADKGIAITEHQTDICPAVYVLVIDKKPIGIIETKRVEESVGLSMYADETEEHKNAKLKCLDHRTLFFRFKNTVDSTFFADYCNLKPKPRPIFTFPYQETLTEWLK